MSLASLLNWLPWLLGGSTIALVALALLAPHLLTVLTPWLKAASEGIIEYLKALWGGFVDMTDNSKSIIFVVTIALVSYWYGTANCPKSKLLVQKDSTSHTFSVKRPSTKEDNAYNPLKFDHWFR